MPRKLAPFTAAGPREITGQPLAEVPEPPAWLTPVAQEKFREVAGYLVSLGAVTDGEVDLVVQYAAVWSRWREAEEAMAAAGGLHYRAVQNRQGEAASAVALPAMAQAAKCLDQLRRLTAALGLSPVERLKLPAVRDPGPIDEMEILLARHEAERANEKIRL